MSTGRGCLSSPLRGLTRNVLLLGLVSLSTDVSTEMIYPLVPLFLTGPLGAPVWIAGLVEGAADMTASLLRLISGWLSDRWGPRRPFVFGGYGLAAVAKPILALAAGWPVVLAARLLDRFGKGLRGAARDAMIAESTPPEDRGRAFGFHRMLDQTGAILGPLLAFALLPAFGGEFRAVFVAALLPAGLGVALLLWVRETGAARPAASAIAPWRWKDTTAPFRQFLMIAMLFALGNASNVYLALRSRQLGMSAADITLLFAAFNAATVASAFPAGALSDRWGRKRMLITAQVLFTIGYAGFAAAPASSWLWILFLIHGTHAGIIDAVGRALVVDLVAAEHRATCLGLHAAATGVMALAASALAGLFWESAGPAAPFLCGAALATVSTVLLGFWVRLPSPRPQV